MTENNAEQKKPKQKKCKRRSKFIKIIISVVIVVLLFQYGLQFKAYGPSRIPDRIILTWTDSPASTQAVTWRSGILSFKAFAQIAPQTSGPDIEKNARRLPAQRRFTLTWFGPAWYNTVNFTGLDPETEYLYRVGDGKNFSEWTTFKTASLSKKAFSFIYLGDVQNDIKSRAARVIQRAFADTPAAAFYLYAGDLVNDPTDSEWGQWFYATDPIHRTIPCMATPGNHEYNSGKITSLWTKIFEFPKNGPEFAQERTYYFDYQGVRFISLDSTVDPEQQKNWLEKTLSAHNNKWTVAMFHYPVYSGSDNGRDNKELRDAWQPLFDRYDVDLVLQGHDHVYARSKLMKYQDVPQHQARPSQEDGTVYVVSVTGPKMYPLKNIDFMESSAKDTQFYQVITIDGDRIDYKAKTADGKLYDSFILQKTDNGNNKLITHN